MPRDQNMVGPRESICLQDKRYKFASLVPLVRGILPLTESCTSCATTQSLGLALRESTFSAGWSSVAVVASAWLANLVFNHRQELMRLLVEDVTYHPGRALVRTIAPVDGQGDNVSLCTTVCGG